MPIRRERAHVVRVHADAKIFLMKLGGGTIAKVHRRQPSATALGTLKVPKGERLKERRKDRAAVPSKTTGKITSKSGGSLSE
jgi:hypothetical protein